MKLSLPILLSFCAASAGAAQLTETETRWLQAGSPVLAYAKQELNLPIDIVVQPQAGPNDVPLAMGFADGRCKLVFSMRGNPQAEEVLNGVPAAQQKVLIEAMTAHEVGHCWRQAHGSWHALPAGFVEGPQEQLDSPELQALSKAMRDTRREEAFSDLVALAWTQRANAGQYRQVHAWLMQVRQPVAHSSHNTRAWLQLAADGSVFDSEHNPFEQARALWGKGLLKDEQ
ncbi:hypothetical protein [Pseudoduganella violaceinigra]|uniref:hypothetical protein n=1 Tax=Pseudoduganella violaceinigra TaxID=246602 RepID=UPI000416BAEC|nr:hypothetical protein [Pseudoduganella violaceinigra]